MFKPTLRMGPVGAVIGAWVCCAHPFLAAAQEISSPDGLWIAEIDEFGQVDAFYTPDQPGVTHVPETLVYVATDPDLLSHRVESIYPLTVGPIVDPEGSHSFARFESPVGSGDCCVPHATPGCEDPDCEAVVCGITALCCIPGFEWDELCTTLAFEECDCFPPTGPLAIEIENLMIGGPNGGVLVTIRATNESATDPVSAKLFYYCDFDINETNNNDEAEPVFVPGGGILAVEQYDAPPADPPTPLWFGGCPDYAGWEIGEWGDTGGLSWELDQGRAQLANADTTEGPLDHVCALSSAMAVLGPGESLEVRMGIGGPGFDTCTEPLPCPWDCDPPGDGEVGVTDFLQMLAEWGGPGNCDFDGDGVSITDFLDLLANWGPCP
ncbi:MAG: hypothetical protein ACYSW2_12365 [Planctomycetota bacterium]